MKIEWLTIGKHRHLCVDGKAICEKFGGYTQNWANPCGSCLNLLHQYLGQAFMERNEATEANTTVN